MISCVIIEDLKVAADYLRKCCDKHGMVEVKGYFPEVNAAVGFLNENTVDLLFLDVEMPGATGFDLLDRIAYRPHVILTTSKEEYAYNAFQYHVTDFLKKPFNYQRFTEAMAKITIAEEKAAAAIAPPDHIFIKADGKLIRLQHEEILYIESMGDYVRFVTADKKYITHNTIKNLEERIKGDHFMKVHRSYIINLLKIDDIRENDLYIRGIEIPISKAHKADVLKRITIL